MNHLEELLQGMISARVIEDRREYMPEDLAHAYGLDELDSIKLYMLIQNLFKS
jgi:hypothetical protein